MIFCGKKKSGKTHLVKEYLDTYFAGLPRLINDVNNEYGVGLPPPPEEFIKRSLNFKQGVVVYEEATSMFGYQRDDTTAQVMTRSRHTGVSIIFCFHSISDIPRYIARNSDFLVLFKTGDVLTDVASKFGRGNTKVINAFLELQKADLLKTPSGVEYSPKKITEL